MQISIKVRTIARRLERVASGDAYAAEDWQLHIALGLVQSPVKWLFDRVGNDEIQILADRRVRARRVRYSRAR
jgi:hypothetical protein